jgi:hypothetical protein
MDPKPPDVVLLGSEWPDRALLRAQLLEEGWDVVAIDTWPMPRLYRRPDMEPRTMVIDLRGLPEPRAVLDDVRVVLPPDRVLVIMALGSISEDDVRGQGFEVIQRPATVGDVVAAVSRILRTDTRQHDCTDTR